MKKKLLLTISRQFGSGGHEIGELLSQKLGLKLYDREILFQAAQTSGIEESLIESFDEKPINSFLYSLAMGAHPGNGKSDEYEIPLPGKIFLAQFNAIRKIAKEDSGIFIGRCADYILKNYEGCVRVFIYAPVKSRIARIQKLKNINETEAEELIRRMDKRRASYYNYHTTGRWGNVNNYQLCIDSSFCGTEGTAQGIYQMLKETGYL